MRIRPIRTDKDHASAMREIGKVWGSKPGTPEHDDLEVLAVLISAYEDKRWPIPAADPIGAIKFHMEQGLRTQADLARVLGSSSRASEILNRKRHLTTEMIWALSREWGIPAESLIEPYELDRPSEEPASPAKPRRAARKSPARRAGKPARSVA